jgi:DNA-binding XRE family transcriptional regulator
LTKNQATKVKCLAAQGVTDSDLAGEFGVSAGSIRRCRLGHSYAYAVGPITKRPHRSRPPEIADKNIGSKLRTARLRSGKHQGKLAEEVGISQAHLSRVELGKDNPSKDLVYRLQAATGIQVLIAEHVKDRK